MLKELYGTTFTVLDLFDLDFYRQNFGNPPFETQEEALDHYNTQGWKDGLNPSPRFDTKFYLTSNPDVHVAGSPLIHYIKHGQYEGRRRMAKIFAVEVLSELGIELYERMKPFTDRTYYFSQSGHDVKCGVDVVMHYFIYGYNSGLKPIPRFDEQFYLEHNADVADSGTNPLLHYARYGFKELRRSGPMNRLFSLPPVEAAALNLIRDKLDVDYYRSKLPGLNETDIDPAAHYYFYGEAAGFDPNREFSSADYLHFNPDVKALGVNAFHHYLTTGQAEGRLSTPTGYPALRPATVTMAEFDTIALSPGYLAFNEPVVPFVYVILPVYRGYDETLGALKAAVTARCETPFKLLVLDDHSPDPKLSQDIAAICGKLGADHVYNEVNLGFVANVNKGLSLVEAAGPAHVVLLNADTVVYDGWLDRMQAHLTADPTIATITPMSNNATIMSYPRFCTDNRFALEVPHADLASMACTLDQAPVDVLTGVGFAMFISREALDRVGRLDVAAFGKGYGEEVDFCQRALREGMRNVAAPDVFVTHYGSVSFAETHKTEYEEGQAVLKGRYPLYEMAVFDFMHGDPLQPVRQAYDLERLARLCAEHPYVLSISHGLGGGIQTYVDQMTGLAETAKTAFIDITITGGACVAILPQFPGVATRFDNLGAVPLEAFVTALRRLAGGAQWILFNSMIGAAARLRSALTALLTEHADRLVYVLHDFAVHCPRANFTHVSQTYCDGPQPVEKCQGCVRTFATTPDLDVVEWRAHHMSLLTAARRVVSPSQSAPRYLWGQPELPVVVRPHWEPDLQGLRPLNNKFPRPGEKLVFAVLGAIGPHKGSRLLRALKSYINTYEIDMEIHLVGYCDLEDLPDDKAIFVHGAYQNNAEAIEVLNKIRPHAVLGLSTWPETYCYALSIALAIGIPVIALNVGAQGERVAAYSRGVVLDFGLRNDIADLATELMTVDLDALWKAPVMPWKNPPYADLDAYFGEADNAPA
ncbi:glycosyltransferase [Asticcacaulis sp. AC402]|uniref:glycosyltransferase n=1 Tax=Asticcacaulis sp. AC402 TaxID=1282361 RepID=UPI0003C3E128|nr:glycosyltransferase [Asticcacaulis sp. AC402]ESQ73901.1 hypothetical protein ABAC402_16770 [Asticcacaulis sp. AC402]